MMKKWIIIVVMLITGATSMAQKIVKVEGNKPDIITFTVDSAVVDTISYEIVDICGKTIDSGKCVIENNTFYYDVMHLTKGIYFIRYTPYKEESTTIKFRVK